MKEKVDVTALLSNDGRYAFVHIGDQKYLHESHFEELRARCEQLEKLVDQWEDPESGFVVIKKKGALYAAEELVEAYGVLRRALKDVLNSEVVKSTPFSGYSEALDRARIILAEDCGTTSQTYDD